MITFILCNRHKTLTDTVFNMGGSSRKEAGALIILPEQYSFEGEGQLYLNYDRESREKIEITTITKLTAELTKEAKTRPHLTSAAAEVLLRRIIIENEGKLRFFKGKNAKFAFVAKLLSINNELINGGVLLERISLLSEREGNKTLGDKLHDIALLLNLYRVECESRFDDINEDMKNLCNSEDNLKFFKERDIFFCGYSGFKDPQGQLLKSLIENKCDITFAFLADNLVDESFLIIKEVIERIERMAIESNTPFETKYIEDDEKNLQSSFAAEVFSDKKVENRNANVQVIKADNRYDEIAEIAAIIKNAVLYDGARYSDFLIVARNISEYQNPVSEFFTRADIPFYTDKKTSLITSSPAAVVLFALRYAIFGGAVSDAVDFAKTALLKIDDEDFAQFLSYIEVFNIKGSQLKGKFSATRAEFSVLRVEDVRKKIVTPLLKFKDNFNSGDRTVAIWELLCDIDYQNNLKEYSKNKDSYYVRELRRQYDELIGLLDEVYAATMQALLLPREYYELINRMLSACQYGSVERMIDEVVITNLSTIPRTEKKTVFIIGANEGVYPLVSKEGSLFSTFERRILGRDGIEILDNALYNYRFDIYNIYSALKLAQEKLYITYPAGTLVGDELLSSSFVLRVVDIIGEEAEAKRKNLEFYINSKEDLRDILSTGRAQFCEGFEEELFSAKPFDYSISLQTMESVLNKDIAVYPTTIEMYANCPFSYFCRYILGARTLLREELSPLSSGNIIHYCLEQLMIAFNEFELQNLSKLQILEFIEKVCAGYLAREFSELSINDKRFNSNLKRVKKSLLKVINFIIAEYKESSFRVSELEVSIGENGTEPYIIDIGDGYNISLRGKVDRVDCLRDGDDSFLRVIDYKSGNKVFNLADLKNGVNLQLFIYLFALIKSGKYKDFLPAGALYQPSFAKVLAKVSKEEPDLTINKSLTKNGLFLDDEKSLDGMERKREGIFIPVTAKTTGKIADSLATIEEMGKIERMINDKIEEMGRKIIQGQFTPLPLKTKSSLRCDFCDYKAVCKRRDDEEVRIFAEYEREEFYDGY